MPSLRHVSHRWLVLGACVASLAACDSPTDCTSELSVVQLTPLTLSIPVGQTLRPVVVIRQCGGEVPVLLRAALTSSDPRVMRPDEAGPSAVALAPGVVRITVRDSTYGRVAQITVTVTTPP
jgi:hypothetical protein